VPRHKRRRSSLGLHRRFRAAFTNCGECAPEEIWASREDVVYALGMGQDGRLLAGTGNSGALLAVDGRGVFAQLAKAGSSQITGIARNAAGKIFLCTANPGKVVTLGRSTSLKGFTNRDRLTRSFFRIGAH